MRNVWYKNVDRCCPFGHFLLTIVLAILLRFTDSDYPNGIFKLFLFQKQELANSSQFTKHIKINTLNCLILNFQTVVTLLTFV